MSSGPLHPKVRTGRDAQAYPTIRVAMANGADWVGAVIEGGMSALRKLRPEPGSHVHDRPLCANGGRSRF
jgi:hypothetical protein